jgi:formylmethanofuran dehydrogenase subunit E
VMPAEALLQWQYLGLSDAADELRRPPRHVTCARCGEEVLNGREVVVRDQVVCRPCAGHACFEPSLPRPGL